jgi:hypothetical protein
VPSESPVCVIRCPPACWTASAIPGVGDLARNPQRVGDRQLPFALESCTQRLALDERHHIEQLPLEASRIEQRQDVRVLQRRRELDLLQESIGAEHGGEFGVQQLERDLTAMPNVLRQVDGRHAARAELALDAVAVGETRAEVREQRAAHRPSAGGVPIGHGERYGQSRSP